MKKFLWQLFILTIVTAFILTACGSAPATTEAPQAPAPTAVPATDVPQPTAAPATEAPTAAAPAQPALQGQTIDVLLPPWAQIPQEMLDAFEKESGVKVNLTIADWGAIRDKVSVAGAAGSKLADVVEFDWSWTGQFSKAGWFVPLEDKLPKDLVSDLVNTGAFTIDGHLYAVPYSNDYRISAYNNQMFETAGITQPPATFDELKADLKTLKDKGASKSPLCMFMSPTENTSTTWYLLTTAMGGTIFDKDMNPAFSDPNSAGYKALQFMVDMNKAGYVEAGAFNPDTSMDTEFISGKCAFHISTGPALMSVTEDPKQSSIAGQAKFTLVPGESQPVGTFGLPEGLGIMSKSEHQEAALAFIQWWMKPENIVAIQSKLGLMPTRSSVLSQEIKDNKLPGGQVVLDQANLLQPLFASGTPSWYSQFSQEAANSLNSALKGDLTVQAAIDRMAAKAKDIQQQ
jgi:multiple sugar transport system substrate-binding protein